MIAVTFLGSAIAAAVLPWRRPEIYDASPIARYKVLGIPLITFTAGLFIAFLVFCLYKWFTDPDEVYAVNDSGLADLHGLPVPARAGDLRRRPGCTASGRAWT